LRPTRTAQHNECSSGHGSRFLANLWQMALRAGVEVALCLVELRGFEPLTPCMPCSFAPCGRSRSAASAQRNDRFGVTVADRCIPLVTAAYGTAGENNDASPGGAAPTRVWVRPVPSDHRLVGKRPEGSRQVRQQASAFGPSYRPSATPL